MRILKNYLYNLTNQLVNIVIPVVTIPYISRVLGPEMLGINAYANSIISYFVLIANLGISIYGNRTIAYARDSLEARSEVFWEIIFIKLIMASLAFVSLFLFLKVYGEYTEYIYMYSILIFATAVDISWFFAGLEDFRKIVIRNIFVKIFSFLLIFLLVKSGDDLLFYILIISLSNFLGNFALWGSLKAHIKKIRIKQMHISLHFYPILILFLPQVASSVFMTLNKILLANISNISEVGFFDNSDKIIRILLTILVSIGTVIFPRLANSYKKGDIETVKNFLKISFDISSFLSFPFAIGLIVVSSSFSSVFFGDSFGGIELVISILALELIFMGWSSNLGNQFLVAINESKGLTISLIFAIIVVFLSSLFLLPIYGAKGAAITSVLGELIILLVQLYFVRKHLSLVEIFSDTYKFIIASLVMGIVIYYFGELFNDGLIKLFFQVIIGFGVYMSLLFLLKPRFYYLVLSKFRG
ncbi:oligosaccharide flippase family protein [Bisgaard Taxon 10/6]|uniref:Oligosaccharide flippase family protein n=1 Tax=Exercitatus varius TaxID=67857 RepID=A0ABT6EPJ1_9PAST|nr:oligosaccharide flippase family protein [Exercitatus varius]MDG2945457.1 oligosaccharide flippase family protein [Exercitatus varius]